MWIPTESEAVEMYARYYTARHESNAAYSARATAIALKAKGDTPGYKIWSDVADTIDRHNQERRHDPTQTSH